MKPNARGKWIAVTLLGLLSVGVVWQQQQQRPAAPPPAAGAAPPAEGAPAAATPASSRATGSGGTTRAAGPDSPPALPNPIPRAAPAVSAPPTGTNLPATAGQDPAGSEPINTMPLEPLISQTGKQSKIARDGTPLRIELSPGQPATAVELQAWTKDQTRNAAGRYDWRFKLTVPAGGLVERLDPTVFTAPEEDYRKDFDYAMDQNMPANQWANSFGKSFFIHFDNDTYGLLNVQMVAGGAHFTAVKSYLNPATGSRNLQPPPPPPVKMR